MGGVGNYQHLSKGIKNKNCDAISTANLFNFIGNEFYFVRKQLVKINKLPFKKSKKKYNNLKIFFDDRLQKNNFNFWKKQYCYKTL